MNEGRSTDVSCTYASMLSTPREPAASTSSMPTISSKYYNNLKPLKGKVDSSYSRPRIMDWS